MFGKIWQRYFLAQTLKMFFLILICFYVLYFLIDYASRSSGSQAHSHFHLNEVLSYYFFEFVQRLDILIPFALLISTVRTLTQINAQNELVALLASGVSLKTILRPFVILGLICVAIVYANYQFAIPAALKEIRHIQDVGALKSGKKNRKDVVQSVALKDHSVLLYHDFDSATDQFFDAYWIKSFDDIYHIKHLSPNTKPPQGTFVDHLVRNKTGKMEKAASFSIHDFPEMKFNKRVLLDSIIPPEELSLTKLWQKLPENGVSSSEKEAELSAVFYHKLVMPWFCFFAVLGPAPLCLRFSRYFPVFFIYGLSIFGLAACYIILNASVELGARQVVSPFWAILTPFLLFMSFVILRFLRLK